MPQNVAQKISEHGAVIPLSIPGVGGISAGDPSSPALICLHGWGGSCNIWRRFLSGHPSGRYIVSLDFPGSGASLPLTEWSQDALAKWVLDVADKLGIDQFAVMGHSMGGNVAAHVAVMAGQRVTHLLLVDAAIFSDRLHSEPYLHRTYGRLVLTSAWLGSGLLGLLSPLFPENESGGFWRPWLRRCRYLCYDNSHNHMRDQMRALVASPFDIATLREDLPVLIVHGEKDTVVPVAEAHEIASLLADRAVKPTLRIHGHAHHVPMDTDPVAFILDVCEFLGD